jgi:outer membrane protein OmpA-like peptidoglycan-associated protein
MITILLRSAIMNARSSIAIGFLICTGCASTVPRELADARATYRRAASGPAARENPAQLHVAERSLALAEKTYDDEGDSDKARDRAYVALRKAQLAEIQSRIKEYEQQSAQSQTEAQRAQARSQADTKNQLGNASQQLAAQQKQLETERQLRLESERRAAESLASLERIASVKKDGRGVVITLPGGVLFATGKSELLATAKAKLTEVAGALTKDPQAKIVVEGHTDSRGADNMNQELSAKRAEAVKSFLVSKGVSPDNISSDGFGETRPIADNESPEGRANNRRVEIVVHPSTPAAVGGGVVSP